MNTETTKKEKDLPTVLVTGGAGYIGSQTCKALARSGYKPVVYDTLERGYEEAVQWGPLERGNVLDKERLINVMRTYEPQAVVHFAAYAYVGEAVDNPLLYHRNNVSGTVSLLEAMTERHITKLVFSSSCATYGIPQSLPITEDTLQLPINPYGQSKLICEKIIQDVCASGKLGAVILRYFNAAGADLEGQLGECHDPETHVIPLMLMAALGKAPPLSVFGDDYSTQDGTCVRDYIHVADLADAHVQALSKTTLGTFLPLNLGKGQGYSILEILAAAEKITGVKVPHAFGPRRHGDPAELVADASRAKAELGWEPRHSDVNTILKTAWTWINRAN